MKHVLTVKFKPEEAESEGKMDKLRDQLLTGTKYELVYTTEPIFDHEFSFCCQGSF